MHPILGVHKLRERSMTKSYKAEGTLDVPVQVFEEFLQALKNSGTSVERVTRLRKALLEDRTFTERALKAAVLGEEPVP